ncbi:hypothetical protein ACP4OV_011882 [Aristida adscensionis]
MRRRNKIRRAAEARRLPTAAKEMRAWAAKCPVLPCDSPKELAEWMWEKVLDAPDQVRAPRPGEGRGAGHEEEDGGRRWGGQQVEGRIIGADLRRGGGEGGREEEEEDGGGSNGGGGRHADGEA